MKVALLTPKWRWYCQEVMEDFVKHVNRPDYTFDIIHTREITKRLLDYDWILSYPRFQRTYQVPLFQEIRDRFIVWVSGLDCYRRIKDWGTFRYAFVKSKSIALPQLQATEYYIQPSGVDTQLFKPLPVEKQWLVGFVGKVKPHMKPKQKQVIEIFIPACEKAQVSYHVHDAMKKFIPRGDLPELYNRFEAYMCTSKWEGGPQPLLEGGACGLALISSRVGYAEHGLIQDNGFICDTFNEFVEALRYLHEHPKETRRMGRRSRETILKHWDWKIQAEQLISKIEGLK